MTIAESLYQKWDAHRVLQFQNLCERFKTKYSYSCDILNLRFMNIYEFKDGSSLVFGTEYTNRDMHHFCEVKNA